jgi:hypothetical protein
MQCTNVELPWDLSYLFPPIGSFYYQQKSFSFWQACSSINVGGFSLSNSIDERRRERDFSRFTLNESALQQHQVDQHFVILNEIGNQDF